MTTGRRAIPRPSVRDFRPPYVAPASLAMPKPATVQPGPQATVLVVVPGKPLSENATKRPAIRGRRAVILKTDEAEDWTARARFAAGVVMRGREKLTGDLAITVTAYWPRRNADSDGPLKPAKDALQGIVYANDRVISEDHTRRRYDPDHPRTEIEVRPLGPAVRVDEMDDGQDSRGPA